MDTVVKQIKQYLVVPAIQVIVDLHTVVDSNSYGWVNVCYAHLKCLNAYVHGEMLLMSTLDMVSRVINLLIKGKPPSIVCVKRFISPPRWL